MTVHDGREAFGRYYEEFEVGDVFKHWPGRTITEYDDILHCMQTMNHHPSTSTPATPRRRPSSARTWSSGRSSTRSSSA